MPKVAIFVAVHRQHDDPAKRIGEGADQLVVIFAPFAVVIEARFFAMPLSAEGLYIRERYIAHCFVPKAHVRSVVREIRAVKRAIGGEHLPELNILHDGSVASGANFARPHG